MEKLVREFLTAQSLTILPQNSFGDAVGRFVDKDDKHAMEVFVNESLSSQVKNLLEKDELQEHDIATAMEQYRTYLESNFVAGQNKNRKVSQANIIHIVEAPFSFHRNRRGNLGPSLIIGIVKWMEIGLTHREP